MENLAVTQIYFPVPSPDSHNSSNSPSGISSAANNDHHHHHHSPPSPVATIRSEPTNTSPTTFVQADTSSFKQIVQMLTGSTETARLAARPELVRSPIQSVKTGPRKDKSGSKLYERRNSLKNFRISPLGPGLVNSTRAGLFSGFSAWPRPRPQEILSPSILDFPSLVLSPVTPLLHDPFNREAAGKYRNGKLDKEAEEKAIKEKGFYLHPSPGSSPRDSEPRLLPLFPVTSPRVTGSSKADDS